MTQTAHGKKTPFGKWPSPLTADALAQGAKRFGDTCATLQALYWTQSVPAEKSRMAILRSDGSSKGETLLKAPFSARSKVHEYGGGSFTACAQHGDDLIFFINDADQDIYRLHSNAETTRLTELANWRFADLDYCSAHNALFCVAERHIEGSHIPENMIVRIDLDQTSALTSTPEILVSGADFYATPRANPAGTHLAWISWNLPDMPWDGAILHQGEIDADGRIKDQTALTQSFERAVCPAWQNDHTLLSILESPEKGKGMPIAFDTDTGLRGNITSHPEANEIDAFIPLWVFGLRSLAHDAKAIGHVGFHQGRSLLAVTTSEATKVSTLPGHLESIVMHQGHVAGFLSRVDAPTALARQDSLGSWTILAEASEPILPSDSVSLPQLIQFAAGEHKGHALYYAPKLANHTSDPQCPPPMIVSAHGGPTGYASRGFEGKIQYFTTRGFAFLDVDYRGSAGYGRAYREALDTQWGVADVEDVISAATACIKEGKANESQIFISGGSAGGYTVLAALVATDLFCAGTSKYGIGDLSLLAKTTHKFEAGYLDRLIGLKPGMREEERQSAFLERSPIQQAGKISSPVLFLQGLDDKVVPPSQAETMIAALKTSGIPVAYQTYAGEGHGFRQPQNIANALKIEHAFYLHALGLDPAEDAPEIPWV